MTAFWQILIGNLATVALVVSLWTQAQPWLEAKLTLSRDIIFGIAMGLGAVLSMIMSVQFQPGVFFDLRHALIAIAGLFGGVVSVMIAALMSTIFRVFMGGTGIIFGLTGIVAVAGISIAVHHLIHRRDPVPRDVVVLAVAVSGVWFLIAASRFSPVEHMDLLKRGLPTMALNFTSVLVCGVIMVAVRDYTRDRDLARFAIAQSPGYYYIKDTESRFRMVNEAVAKLHGFARSSDMKGLSDFDLTTSNRAQALDSEERIIMSSGIPLIDREECVETPLGKKWYSTTKIAVHSERGDVMGLAGVTQDITARKQMEHELASSRMHLDYAMREMTDGLALFSDTGHLVFCNDQYRAFFPKTAHVRVSGTHLRDILAAVLETDEQVNIPKHGQTAWIDEVSSSLLTDNDQDIRTHSGGWLQIKTRRTHDGSALVMVTDMTIMKESEIALRQLTEQLRSLAETDGLTGLINRRVFDVRLEGAIESASNERPVSLLMIDVDRFKAFNDRYGHTAGDECLKAVADCLRAVGVRASDTVARYGGEEFAVILPNTDASGAFAVAERFRQMLAARALLHEGSDVGCVTASVGVGTIYEVKNPSWLINMADEALYVSKTSGRNRTTSA